MCRLFCHMIFVSFCCLPIKKFADSKELIWNAIHDKLFYNIYQVLQVNF